MRRRLALLLLAVLLAAAAPWPDVAARASCVGPQLLVDRGTVLTRGAPVEVRGEFFVDGCQDTIACTQQLGCTRCDSGPEPRPLTDQRLRLVQGDREWELGTTDARGQRGELAWAFTVPPDAAPGRAVLRVGQVTRARVQVG